ncbi:MAG: rhomboid family intramembrane serine protease [Bryobacteraceae bacterium]
MCPNCRAFINIDDKVCPYCETALGPRAAERRSPTDALGGLIPHARFTTTVILLVNFGLYIATTLYSMKGSGGMAFDIDGQTLFAFGAKVPFGMMRGQWWRLVTAGFLHGGILHILMNSWVLFDLGAQVEEVYGTSRYLVVYFVATITGFLASAVFGNAGLSVGASAGILGLIGAMIALGVRHRHTAMGASMRSHYTQWVIFIVVIGLLPGLQVDNAAHLGGLVGGFIVAYIANTPSALDVWQEKFWRVLATVCVILTAVCFGLMFLNFAGSYRYVL